MNKVIAVALVSLCLVLSPTVAEATPAAFHGMPTVRLTNGRLEAVISVPLGRVISFGPCGGPNILWQSPVIDGEPQKYGPWRNWGGERTWLAPQSGWPASTGTAWPPDAAWDTYTPRRRRGTRTLVLVSAISPRSGIQITRMFRFARDGRFVIDQKATNVAGSPTTISLWHITQVNSPEAVYFMPNPRTHYPGDYMVMTGKAGNLIRPIKEKALTKVDLHGSRPDSFKIGVDTDQPVIASRKGTNLLIEYSTLNPGRYPDGGNKRGFPVEIFDSGGVSRFTETELLSPLYVLAKGQSCQAKVTWRLLKLSTRAQTQPQRDYAVDHIVAKLCR